MLRSQSQPEVIPFILWGIGCLIIIGAITGGLLITGGPQTERMRRMDERRTQDLFQLEQAIAEYFRVHQLLPNTLRSLKNIENYSSDPETAKPYRYQKMDADSFRLWRVLALRWKVKPALARVTIKFYL